MEDVVKAIEKLAEKTWMDYALVIVPIIVSMVAIVISIATARKQNRIALFERRHNCLFQIKMILNFSESIQGTKRSVIVLALFDAFWGANIIDYPENEQIIKVKCQLEAIKKDIDQYSFLFDRKYCVSPMELFECFHGVVISITSEPEFPENEINEFIEICNKFSEKDFYKMQKHTKL